MSKKFDDFIVALEELVAEHKVEIIPVGFDLLEVWDREELNPGNGINAIDKTIEDTK